MARPFGSIVSVEKLIAGLPFNFDDAIRRYNSGEALEPLAHSLGVSFGRLRLVFQRAGVPLRNRSSALRVRMKKIGPKGRAKLVAAAHRAVKGRKKPIREVAERVKLAAITREIHCSFIGKHERELALLLVQRGLIPIPQKSVGSYNIDVAIFPVAVEIHTATNHPLKMPKFQRRLKYLLDCGWWVIYVRPTKTRPLSEIAADEILAFYQLAQRNPTLRGQYRVIWGSGECSPIEGMNAHKKSSVSTLKHL